MKTVYAFLSIILYLLTVLIPVLPCEIRVGHTYDLRLPMEEIKEAFEKTTPACFVNLLALDSQELKLISKDSYPKVDVIVWDDFFLVNNLAKIGFINQKTIQKLAYDKLCVVVKKSIAMRPFLLYPRTQIVNGLLVANPGQTALGKYTKEALSRLGLWKKLSSKLILLENNEYISNAVGRGNFDGGIMYCSCAENSFVQITDILNPKLYSGIIYSSAITTKSSSDKDIVEFNRFLMSKKSKTILNKYHLK